MSGFVIRWPVCLWGLLLPVIGLAPASAEMARVERDDGTVLRGDVEVTDAEVLIRNVAGVVRYPRAQVTRIEWLEPARSAEGEYSRRVFVLAEDDVAGHWALAEWLVDQRMLEAARQECEHVLSLAPEHPGAKRVLERIEREAGVVARTAAGKEVATRPAGDRDAGADPGEGAGERPEGVAPPPPLSGLDITRLKLSEIELDAAPERLAVRFLRSPGKRDVEDLVRDEIDSLPDVDPAWIHTLERGQLHEKLPVVLKATGLKYADRIEARGDPAVFEIYRRRVLPLVNRGCVRSGCHGGREAHAFRFPIGSQTSDEFVYTSFAILDRIETAEGPLIDRSLPEESALVHYLLPTEDGEPGHPPVEKGRVTPVLRGTRDHRYRAVVEWIGSLRSPHPDYELEYAFPGWLERRADRPAEPPTPAEEVVEPAPVEAGNDEPP